jgi:hypothetical protein
MPKKRFSSEQLITKLRQIEVQLPQGKSIALACKEAALSEQSYFRWRKEYGGLQIEQARRLARSLQPRAAPLISGLSATGTCHSGGHHAATTHNRNHAAGSMRLDRNPSQVAFRSTFQGAPASVSSLRTTA